MAPHTRPFVGASAPAGGASGATDMPAALALLAGGHAQAAAQVCRRILVREPGHFDALSLLGIVATQSADWAQARSFFEQAVTVRPADAGALGNLAAALAEAGRFEESLAAYDRALQLHPPPDRRRAQLHYGRGNALRAAGRLDAALASYEQALHCQPDHVDALNNRGVVLAALRRTDEALASYEAALLLQPGYAQAHNNRGVALRELGRLGEALASYDRALAADPGYVEALINRGVVLHDLRRYDEALDSHGRALQCQPAAAQAHLSRGNTLRALGRHAEALAAYAQAIALAPRSVEAYSQRGIALYEMRRDAEALDSYAQALALDPQHADAHWNEAFCRLMIGDYTLGWQKHEWRWKIGAAPEVVPADGPPLWLGGTPVSGATVLLRCEQGYGDAIQFCRYAQLVTDLGARVVLQAPPALTALFGGLACVAQGVAQVIDQRLAPPPADFQVPLMSLPLALRTELATIPARVPYLVADRARAGRFHELLGVRSRPRVGLVWSSGVRVDSGRTWEVNDRRNIALAQLWAALAPLASQAIDCFSLQKGPAAEAELLAWRDGQAGGGAPAAIADWTHALGDFADTAALIEHLDLVISVDTAVAHLAAAMGKPTWILLCHDACWRWLRDRHDSPWYPTVTLFRQERPGDWGPVVERVGQALGRQFR